jgi:hypothetical protein
MNSFDFKSDSFRYPIDKKGMNTLDNIKIINFKELSLSFKSVMIYLDGVTDALAVIREYKNL